MPARLSPDPLAANCDSSGASVDGLSKSRSAAPLSSGGGCSFRRRTYMKPASFLRRWIPALRRSSSTQSTLPSLNRETPGRVALLRYTPEHVELRVEAAEPSFLLAAEGYAPGWRAAIDGIPHALYPANVGLHGHAGPRRQPPGDVGVLPEIAYLVGGVIRAELDRARPVGAGPHPPERFGPLTPHSQLGLP